MVKGKYSYDKTQTVRFPKYIATGNRYPVIKVAQDFCDVMGVLRNYVHFGLVHDSFTVSAEDH